MPLNKKTFWLLAVSSTFLALAMLFYLIQTAQGASLRDQRRMLADTDQQLGQLARDVKRYEDAKDMLSLGGGAIARHEKVSISSRFSPGDLPRLNDFLSYAYDANGFFLMRNFSLQWSEVENEGSAGKPAEATLSLNLNGEKVFTR
jgi:hypothetical protein